MFLQIEKIAFQDNSMTILAKKMGGHFGDTVLEIILVKIALKIQLTYVNAYTSDIHFGLCRAKLDQTLCIYILVYELNIQLNAANCISIFNFYLDFMNASYLAVFPFRANNSVIRKQNVVRH